MNLIENTLYVVPWSDAPDHDFPVLAYTTEGKPGAPRYGGHQVPRIVGTYEDRNWTIGWDTTRETANISLIKAEALDRFITTYPTPLSDWKQ